MSTAYRATIYTRISWIHCVTLFCTDNGLSLEIDARDEVLYFRGKFLHQLLNRKKIRKETGIRGEFMEDLIKKTVREYNEYIRRMDNTKLIVK